MTAIANLGARRECQVRSCPNSGKIRVTALVGGETVSIYLCAAHHAEYRGDEVVSA